MPFCNCGEVILRGATRCPSCKAPVDGAFSGGTSDEYLARGTVEHGADATLGRMLGEGMAVETRTGFKSGGGVAAAASAIDNAGPFGPQCTACKQPTGERHVVAGGSVYCQRCAPATRTVTKTVPQEPKRVWKTTAGDVNPDVLASQSDDICGVCGQVVEPGDGVSILSQKFHQACFVCGLCQKPITDGKVTLKNEVAYHPDCAKKLGDACKGCGQVISGSFVNYQGSKMHSACFKCAQCGGSLSGGFVEKNGSPLCGSCGAAGGGHTSASSTTFTRPSGQRTKGFVVDPMTGKKKTFGM